MVLGSAPARAACWWLDAREVDVGVCEVVDRPVGDRSCCCSRSHPLFSAVDVALSTLTIRLPCTQLLLDNIRCMDVVESEQGCLLVPQLDDTLFDLLSRRPLYYGVLVDQYTQQVV